MTTLISIFCLSLLISFIVTPFVTRLAGKLQFVDMPSKRKVHTEPIPRVGGIAIYLAFCLSFVPVLFLRTNISDLVFQEPRLIYLALGACVIFGFGLWDDVKQLSPKVKFLAQGLAALIAYAGGIRIDVLGLPGLPLWHLEWLSLPATVLWVVLVINAINLTDGLDGLAAGVSFFVCMVLMILCVLGEQFLVALCLAALAGSTLGFLRYNFNPATIFLGDGGSYFLGYMLATLSMLGSIKSHAAVTILIPMIALGVPLMDTLWATVRRFMLGQRLFHPDKEHFHHRLLKIGYTHRRAVLTLYGFTIGMGVLALIIVNARDERAALLLLLVGATIIFGIRKLGYLDYLAVHKLFGWVRDITDEIGFQHDRRTFLARQVAILESNDMDDFWSQVVSAGESLGLDYLKLELSADGYEPDSSTRYCWHSGNNTIDVASLDSRKVFYLNIPLESGNTQLGSLVLAKELPPMTQLPPRMLHRIEHLRRSVRETLVKLLEGGKQ